MAKNDKIQKVYPLTPMQEGMLFHSLIDDESSAYCTRMEATFKGQVDVYAFEQALNKGIESYDILRTAFVHQNLQRPRQVVLRERYTTVHFEDIAHLETQQQQQHIEAYSNSTQEAGFNLAKDTLMKVALFQIDTNSYRLVWIHHHILMDGWGFGILLTKLFTTYAALKNKQPLPEEHIVPYQEYIKWLEKQEKAEAFAYWKNYLATYETEASLPKLSAPLDSTAFHKDEVVFTIGEATTEQLNQIARNAQVTLNSVLQAIWGIALQKYNATDDVVFGSVVSGRPSEVQGIDRMVGLFINTIPVRVQSTAEASFLDVAQSIQQASLDSGKYDYLPLADIQNNTTVKQDLIDHLLVFENYPVEKGLEDSSSEQALGFTIDSVYVNEQSNFDFSIIVAPGSELTVKFDYNRLVYEPAFMEKVKGHLLHIVEQVVANPTISVKEINLVTEAEKQELLLTFNNTKRDFPTDKLIHGLFEEQVAKTPDATAIIFEGERISYSQLNAKANQLAHTLRDKGVTRESVVGIMVERSLDMMVGILAILKAGGAYLPIDPSHPDDRIEFMLEDSGAKLGLSQTPLQARQLTGIEWIMLDQATSYETDESNLAVMTKPSDLSYIIYTSGTTGKPKGVLIEHNQIINTLLWRMEEFGLTTDDVGLQFFSFGFDAFVTNIFTPLLSGCAVVIIRDEECKDPLAIKKYIATYKVTYFSGVPSLYAAILEALPAEDAASLRIIGLGGEKISNNLLEHSQRKNPNLVVINEYGPTESSVIATRNRHLVLGQPITIGSPIPNTRIHILDSNNQLVPIGVVGELCLAGRGTARGYLNRPSLTEEKFMVSPFDPTVRMYKTGDLGRWLPDGTIEFVDRKDNQVKIRGYRIELGEIEQVLLTYDSIREGVVLAIDDASGQKALAAYFVADKEQSIAQVKAFVAQELPAYMVPASFMQLERMPLTANGKVDKRALPQPEWEATQTTYVAPQSEFEEKMATLWADILGVEKVGVTNDFFELGGHSLKAMMLTSRILKEMSVEIPLRILFEKSTIKQLVAYLHGADESIYASIEPVSKRDFYPVSSAQKRMYVLNQIEGGAGTTYNMPDAMIVEGTLDIARVEAAFTTLIERHEALRTSFVAIDGEPMQKVHNEVPFHVTYTEASEAQAEEIVGRFIQPFDLQTAPLFRASIAKLSEERHLLLVDMHHIISDGVSVSVLLKEFVDLYAGASLPEPRIQYKDFAVWQHDIFQKEELQKQAAYWLERFAGELPVLDLPTDLPRPSVRNFAGGRLFFNAGKELRDSLNKLAAETGTTLYMVLLAAYNVLLAKYTSQEDIVVGSPIAGRPHPDVETMIGMFVNTLAFRNAPQAAKTFKQFLQEVKENSLRAYENQDYPFEELVEKLQTERDMSRNPLFDTMFLLQNIDMQAKELDELTFTPFKQANNIAKFDLTLGGGEVGEEIEFNIEYATALFTHETVERMGQHYLNLLQSIVTNAESKLADLEMIADSEKTHILFELNQTYADYPTDKTIHAIFQEQVEKTPDHIAVTCEGATLTYRQLNAKANQLACVLRDKGVKPDGLVGIMVERSLDMLVGIIAILKAGGVYVPIDPTYPEDRISFMLEDSEASILLTQTHLLDTVSFGGTTLDLADASLYTGDDSNLDDVNKPEDMAYIIYTSGTTGKPKGVMIEHRNVVRLLINDKLAFDFNAQDVWTLFHSFCFDFSVWEMYGALLYGGKVVVVPKQVAQNPADFLQLLHDEQVTVLNQTPTAFYSLIQEAVKDGAPENSIRYVVFGGEALNPIMLKPWRAKYQATKLINMYGITETTVHVTYKEITEQEIETNFSNIGVPIPTLTTYIFDQHQKLVPIGVAGEMYVGGDGVARGYLKREELTAERFIQNPYNPVERLYRAGDVARLLPNGEMEYLGRIDHQVKIRGHRIELGEIETQLLKHNAVKEVIVIDFADTDAQRSLCAYFVADGELTIAALRAHLASDLPTYMIPAYFTQLDKMPMTSNGKVDRKALPAPTSNLDTGIAYEAPQDETEALLATIWQNVLGVERVGIKDNFFALGGDSIKAIQVTARLNKYGQKLEVKDLFQHPTIGEVVPYIKQITRQISQETVEGEVGLTPIQAWFFQRQYTDMHHYNQSVMLYSDKGYDPERIHQVFRKIVEHHDGLRMVYKQAADKVVQYNRGLSDEMFGVEVIDLREELNPADCLVAEANRLQASFDLANGPLLKLGLFQTREGDHLLIVIHHLVVDGISWRILFEDFATAYAQVSQNQEIVLPEKTDSFRDWSQELYVYANSKEFLQEGDYWRELEQFNTKPLPRDRQVAHSKQSDSASIALELNADETDKLLKQVNHAYNTEINDILLAGLGLALKDWASHDHICINLEGHGREEIMPQMNISRTIGWFTSQYPIVLDMEKSTELSYQIKVIKEGLRKVPNKGIGYDILRFLTAAENRGGLSGKLKPEISFNYLGQFDADIKDDTLAFSSYDMGDALSPNLESDYALNINGMIQNGTLTLRFSYNTGEYEAATIEKLVDSYKEHLLAIIDHCINKEEKELTPSDFTSKDLDLADVDDIFDLLAEKL